MPDAVDEFRAAVLAALGYAPDVIQPGQMQRFATSAKRRDDAGWCTLFADLRAGAFGCHRAQISGTWTGADPRPMSPSERTALRMHMAQEAAKREAKQRAAWAAQVSRNAALIDEGQELTPGDAVTRYLKARGFAGVWPLPACLRMHPALPYWHTDDASGELTKLGELPAMLAPLIAPDGSLVAVHRTYLSNHGTKADVPTARKLTAASGPLAGASIPLHKAHGGVLGVAEGIETALGAWCASGLPVVAGYSAGNVAAWQWPSDVRKIIVFGDHDPAGRAAAEKLRLRAVASGLRCEVVVPSEPGQDWCDVWAAGGLAEVAA